MRRRQLKAQKGFGIIENLVAISLIGIALTGTTALYVTCFNADKASSRYSAVVSDVQSIVDGYRNGSYTALLDRISSNYSSIANGTTATENTSSTNALATYVTTFTAIKTSANNMPEAVRVRVAATQRRGKLRDIVYTFETVIAQVS